MENQEHIGLSKRCEIRRSPEDRTFYVDHKLESTSYQYPLLLKNLKERGISGYAAWWPERAMDGLTWLTTIMLELSGRSSMDMEEGAVESN
jgi:hypothetical protein